MPLVSKNCIEKIRSSVSMESIVSSYVKLSPSGSNLKGLSPFTEEKTASFFVQPDKNIFKCFSSGYAGDIFRFIQLKENLSFAEAIEFIAGKFGLTLEYETTFNRRNKEKISYKKQIYEIYNFASKFFVEHYNSSEQTQEYCTRERKFSESIIQQYEIGLAPEDPYILYRELKKNNFPHEAIAESGLFYLPKYTTNQAQLTCRFQGRITIPIKDIQGRTIAFSGRKLEFLNTKKDPTSLSKYVNSPEHSLFQKGRILFNLNSARQHIASTPYFVLVEGPLDVMRCSQNGLKTAIAAQGTGITEIQLNIIKRYNVPLICFLDGDKAGKKAAMRVLELAYKTGVRFFGIILANEQDPDSYLLENKSTFAQLKDQMLTPIKFAIKIFKEDSENPDKIQVLDKIFPLIKEIESQSLFYETVKELSFELGIPQKSIEHDFYSNHEAKINNKENNNSIHFNSLPSSLEGQLLQIILNHPELTNNVFEKIDIEWLDKEPAHGKILLRLFNEWHENNLEIPYAPEHFTNSEEELNLWYSLIDQSIIFENAKENINICLAYLYKRFIKKRIYIIDKKMNKLFLSNNRDPINALQDERTKLKRTLKDYNKNFNPPS